MLGEDPELGSAVLGVTTGSDKPATEDGIDPAGGDDADATSDGGPDLPPGVEPDLKDARGRGQSARPTDGPLGRSGATGIAVAWGAARGGSRTLSSSSL